MVEASSLLVQMIVVSRLSLGRRIPYADRESIQPNRFRSVTSRRGFLVVSYFAERQDKKKDEANSTKSEHPASRQSHRTLDCPLSFSKQ